MFASNFLNGLKRANLTRNLKNASTIRKFCKSQMAICAIVYPKKSADPSSPVNIFEHPLAMTLIHKRFYASVERKDINLKFEKGKQIITENIETKRMQLREKKEILVQGIREKKTKVQEKAREKVKEMEEIVERENIFTIPNFLCVGRSFLAPYIGYVIVLEQYPLAIGLLVVAGITDLVRLKT